MARVTAGVLVVSLVGLAAPLVAAAGADEADPSEVGAFSAPFQEGGEACQEVDGRTICKPAGTSMVVLANGQVLFWDALEGMEDVDVNVVAQYGGVAQNDLSRVLDVDTQQFVKPTPEDGGADRSDAPDDEKAPRPELPRNDREGNDGSMFCSDQVLLADGRVLIAGGTSYYLEPGADGVEYGGTELEGLRAARLFDPKDNTYTETGYMNYGRWYPSLVTQPDGSVLATSGVTKLIKPVYTDEHNRGNSGRNVVQVERFDPTSGTWSVLPESANKSLPLYPRLRLLPNGNTYFDAAGQTFNPSGQAYDEATWNTAAVFDADTASWRDLGVPMIGGLPLGFRGSGFTQMLPLRPDADGRYSTVELLSAGGVIGVTPGTYLGTDTTTLNTVTIGEDGTESFASRSVGTLNEPRWYPQGVTLPTGQVLAFNGADRDEVVNPSSGFAVLRAEMYDPGTETWTPLASQTRERTYHNNAVLLPDGRVLLGGHSPIGSFYANQAAGEMSRDTLGTSNPYRDPSFEIFSPPNLFYGKRPVITDVDPEVQPGRPLEVTLDSAEEASRIRSLVLVRNTAQTHIVDGDQRSVEVPFEQVGNRLVARVPAEAAVLPAGPYLLFANAETPKGLTPSVSRQVFVGVDVPAQQEREMRQRAASQAAAEQAAEGSGPVEDGAPEPVQPDSRQGGGDRAGSGSADDGAGDGTAANTTAAGVTKASDTSTTRGAGGSQGSGRSSATTGSPPDSGAAAPAPLENQVPADPVPDVRREEPLTTAPASQPGELPVAAVGTAVLLLVAAAAAAAALKRSGRWPRLGAPGR